MATQESEQHILNKLFDGTDSLIISVNSSPRDGTEDSANEIWNAIYDSTNQQLRLK